MRLLCIKSSDGGAEVFPAPPLMAGREYNASEKLGHLALMALFLAEHGHRVKLLPGDYYCIIECGDCWYHEHHFIDGTPTAEEELEYAEPSELVLA